MADLLNIRNKSTNLPLFSEESNYELERNSVNNKNDMINWESNGERDRSMQTDDQSDTGEESFEAQAYSPNYRSNTTSYRATLEEPETGSNDLQQDTAEIEDEFMEDNRISDVKDMSTTGSFGDFNASNFASQSTEDKLQLEGWDNKGVLNDIPYLDYREVDEDSYQYESNINNDPEYDIDHASNEINTIGEERSEDSGTVEHTEQRNNISRIKNTEEEHNKNSDGQYNLRKLRSQTACGEFKRTFYDYKYNMWQYNDQISATEKMNNVCFTQMSAKRGINTFGEKAVVATVEEYR